MIRRYILYFLFYPPITVLTTYRACFQDPKNKQFAICDDELMKVIGVKRFRTFGMMKYLKSHFVD